MFRFGWFLLFFSADSVVPYSSVMVTTPLYVDVRMILGDGNNFTLRNISKAVSLWEATLACSRSCAMDPACLAFNFCNSEGAFYVCELLPDNVCRVDKVKTFEPSPGCEAWDKRLKGRKEACVDSKYAKSGLKPCDMFKPGCLGAWPNCTNCSKTCEDWTQNFRDNYSYLDDNTSGKATFLWPDGDSTGSLPISARCTYWNTMLLWRKIDSQTGRILQEYKMAFPDAKRLYNVINRTELWFSFKGIDTWYEIYYKNWFLYANGSLTNLTYGHSWPKSLDIFGAKNFTSKIFPFVSVTDDIYGCGSFWLLDPNNATYCPGGNVSVFGNVRMNGSNILSTGIRLPNVTSPLYEAIVFIK